MTDVKATDLTQINKASDVFDLYKGQGSQAKSGIEIEIPFYNPKTPSLAVMTRGQNRVLKNCALSALPEEENWIHNEPTSDLLEIAGNPYDFAHMEDALDDINSKVKVLTEKAGAFGLKRSYFQELPERDADDLLTNLLDVERYRALYYPVREDVKKERRYSTVCKSTQVSVGPRNMDHMLKNMRRLYMLSPFLFLALENSSAFLEGKSFSGHVGMHLRHQGLVKGWGGVLPFMFDVESGEELIARHIDYVMNNPLIVYYDLEGNLVRVPSGDWSVTFNSLKERGFNTSSNYYLAQSMTWPDVKIAALTNTDGEVFGHRYEARMFGVGIHQHQSAYLLVNGLAFHDKFGEAVDDLLARYGFDCDYLEQTYIRLEKAYSLARNHGGRFFDIPYGNGTMANFAKEFADLYEDMAADNGMQDAAKPLTTICRTGYTDTKVNRILFPTLGSALVHQRYYDSSIYENPNRSAYDVFKREVSLADTMLCVA